MAAPIIRIENLGKKYRIQHREGGAKYRVLRDVMADGLQSALGLLSGRRPAGPRTTSEEFWALKDVSFDIHEGEVVGIIGHNGAGKSTLLKVLSRITEPTAGKVTLHGRVASLLEVGTGFHPELTGRENIYLNGSILGMRHKEIERKFDEIVAFAGVEKFLDTPVKRYSSGMHVRLGFAVAAHLEPEILIIDEVLAVGDAAFQKKCLGKMSEVAHSGRTVLFVSHNMASVSNLCRRAVWLERGMVRTAGEARAIVTKYLAEMSKASQELVDLAGLPRRFEQGQRARFLSLEWLSGVPLTFGRPARLRLRFRVESELEEIAIGLGFSFLEGQRFLTFESDLCLDRVRVQPGDDWAIELTIADVPLVPGLYSIDLGIRSGDRATVDYLAAATQVEVVADEDTPSNVMQTANVGIKMSGDWRWVDLNPTLLPR
jgi:lipopolysaccharide transport system ATP-binding protein